MGKFTVYDNKGESYDRYTVFHEDIGNLEDSPSKEALSLSHNPESPNGVSLFTLAVEGEHLGDLIAFKELPDNIQAHIVTRFKES